MAMELEELRVLKDAEAVADGIWKLVVKWEPFARDVVGGQLARAADSIGANFDCRIEFLCPSDAESCASSPGESW